MVTNSIKLGLLAPLSGVVGMYGDEICHAAQIACDEVNEEGGVLGQPLEIIIEDDKGCLEHSVHAARDLLNKHKCTALIGNLLSDTRIAVAYQVAEPARMPYLNFSFYEGSILSRYFFHFAALPNQQIDKMIPYMAKKYGPKLFFAGSNYEWPRGSIHAAKKALDECGGESVGEVYGPIGIKEDFVEELLDQLEQSNANVFVPYFPGFDQLLILKHFSKRGLKEKIAVVMGHFDELMASHLSADERDGFYSSNTYFMGINTPQNKAYLKRLAQRPGINGIWPQGNGFLTNFGEGTYVCVKAFAEAANKSRSIESEALVEALRQVKVDAPQGSVTMDSSHHHAQVNTYLSRSNASGNFDIIETFGATPPVLPERYSHQRIQHQATMEEDIRLQARMLEQLSEAVILVSSIDGTIIYANPGTEKLFGYSKDELVGMPISSLNDPEFYDPQEASMQIIDILNKRGEWKGEVCNVAKNGQRVWCLATISTFTHPSYGEVWLGVHKDITQNKIAEAALRESEARYRRAERGTNDGLWEWDIVSGRDYFSPRWLEILGYAEGELSEHVGSFIELVHPMDKPLVTDAVEGHLRYGQPYDVEFRMRRKDGDFIWIRSRGHAERNREGEPVLMTGSISDISVQKRAETTLLEQQLELERKVKERTEDLSEALIKAEKANTAKSDFLSSMSHELRTPLNAIIGFGQLLNTMKPVEADLIEEFSNEILVAGKHLLELIDQLLDLSKIESSDLKISFEPINVCSLVDECIGQVKLGIHDRNNIQVHNEISDKSMSVKADPLRFKQVIINLVSNAIKYNKLNGTVIVKTQKQGEMTRISVIDSGVGVSNENIDKLFLPFERLNYKNGNIQGTGIGLTITKKLIEAMNGKIGVNSQQGIGSTFWIELPSAESQMKDESFKIGFSAQESKISEKTIKVLCIEDNPANMRLLSSALQIQGNYQVVMAYDAESGIRLANSEQPDVILMDINLPGISGIEAFSLLKSETATQDIPVIAISANAMPNEIDNAKAHGFSHYLSKPIDIKMMLDTIASVVG